MDPSATLSPHSLRKRMFTALAVVTCLLVLVTQVIAVFTVNINWDEFALFHRVSESIDLGALSGGGRPGLVPLALMPLVRACDDPIAVVHRARLLWVPITTAAFGGVFALVLAFLRNRRERFVAAWLAVASLALVPVVLHWSVQVRTDQPAIAAGLWAGVLLLGSRERIGKAIWAGVLLGVGYLCTQKLLYVAGLGGVLAVMDLHVNPGIRAGRELKRALFCLGAMLTVTGSFGPLVSLGMKAAPSIDVEHGFKTFAYYRATFGFRVYRAMLPSLVGQLGLGILLLGCTVQNLLRRAGRDRAITAAWAVLIAGTAVGGFHAGAFPYFWLTLGIFPAVALGVAWPAIDAVLRPWRLVRWVVAPLCVALLIGIGAVAAIGRVHDTQRVQRETLGYITAEFPRQTSGFSFDGALFCMKPPQRMPIYMGEQVYLRFAPERRTKEVTWFIEQLRSRPISFFIASFQLESFPQEIRAYLDSHYVSAFSRVAVAGRALRGIPDLGVDFEVIVPGRYQWRPDTPAAELLLDDKRLGPGESVDLVRGVYHLRFERPDAAGALLLAPRSAPRPPASPQPFYSRAVLADFG